MIVETDFDQPLKIQATLGSFWSHVYAGREQVTDLIAARLLAAKDTYAAIERLCAATSRYTVPVFATQEWSPLLLRESTYQDFSVPRPAKLAEAAILVNRMTAPSVVWVRNLDFWLTDTTIRFRENPFADDRVPKQPIYDSQGQIIDHEALLWIAGGKYDEDTLYQQYGYAINLRIPSSEAAKQLLNVIYDSLVGGTTELSIRRLFSLATGVPIVENAAEVVELVTRDYHGLVIATDQRIYRFHPDATPTVSVGDQVYCGDTLTDALQFASLHCGKLPAWLQRLSLPPSLTLPCLTGPLVFENQNVPLYVDPDDPSGFTRVWFDVLGEEQDVATFFDAVHARGVAAATVVTDLCDIDPTKVIQYPNPDGTTTYRRLGTLAHWLDTRNEKIGEPTAAYLPATINPLALLANTVLRHNTIVVRIRESLLGDTALGLRALSWLSRLTPPQTGVYYVVEMT